VTSRNPRQKSSRRYRISRIGRGSAPRGVAADSIRDLTTVVRREIAALSRPDAASLRLIRRRYSEALKEEPPELVLRFVRSLSSSGAERVVACEVLAYHPGAMDLLNDRLVEAMAEGLSDWGSVDVFGGTVAGVAWREGLVTDSLIASWTRSPDRWRRRLALVATVPLNSRASGGKGDPRRTLRICRALLSDRDDMVVKAMSWALRALAKREPKVVARFVEDHEDQLASRVRREVRNKLVTGLKNPSRSRRKKAQALV
jgi:3-methyladenine DNA glycosylase AlkD